MMMTHDSSCSSSGSRCAIATVVVVHCKVVVVVAVQCTVAAVVVVVMDIHTEDLLLDHSFLFFST